MVSWCVVRKAKARLCVVRFGVARSVMASSGSVHGEASQVGLRWGVPSGCLWFGSGAKAPVRCDMASLDALQFGWNGRVRSSMAKSGGAWQGSGRKAGMAWSSRLWFGGPLLGNP